MLLMTYIRKYVFQVKYNSTCDSSQKWNNDKWQCVIIVGIPACAIARIVDI